VYANSLTFTVDPFMLRPAVTKPTDAARVTVRRKRDDDAHGTHRYPRARQNLSRYAHRVQLASAELFNFPTSAFEPLSHALVEPRDGPVAVLLANGQVLVACGYNEVAKTTEDRYLKTAELTSVAPPVVATTRASAVGTTTATLGGTVIAETASPSYFQYGTTTAYGASTKAQSVSASVTQVAFTASVGGLAPDTTYHYRAVSEDFGGVSYGADGTFLTALPPPTVESVTQSHGRWRRGDKLARISRKKPPVGTTFTFTLNEQAAITLTFTLRVGGRKVKRKCIPPTRFNRHKAVCKRTLTRATLMFAGHAGANRLSFQGRLSNSKRLKLGTYKLLITAANTTGHSSTKELAFTIVG
jgi:hypothetical protein